MLIFAFLACTALQRPEPPGNLNVPVSVREEIPTGAQCVSEQTVTLTVIGGGHRRQWSRRHTSKPSRHETRLGSLSFKFKFNFRFLYKSLMLATGRGSRAGPGPDESTPVTVTHVTPSLDAQAAGT